MNHLVLLGDSIFDNAPYTAGGLAVIDHVHARLPTGWKASLLAVDGSVTGSVMGQLAQLPPDATHLVVSAGGNNALLQSGFVSETAHSVADVLQRMYAITQQFTAEYQSMLNAVLDRALPIVVCTVYQPNFPDASIQELMSSGLIMFNDVILQSAIQKRVPVIDLRRVCTAHEDYANEIEPSVAGGAKIAKAILSAVTQHDFSQQQTTIYW